MTGFLNGRIGAENWLWTAAFAAIRWPRNIENCKKQRLPFMAVPPSGTYRAAAGATIVRMLPGHLSFLTELCANRIFGGFTMLPLGRIRYHGGRWRAVPGVEGLPG